MPPGLTWLYQYDDRGQPYLRHAARDPFGPVDLIREAGDPEDVAIRLWFVRVRESPMTTSTAAAVEVAEVVTGTKSETGIVDLSSIADERAGLGKSDYVNLRSVAEIAVLDSDRGTVDQADVDVDDLADPLLRALHCLTSLARSYRIATHRPGRIPTYQNILPWVLVARADMDGSGKPEIHSRQSLNHDNIPERPPDSLSAEQLAMWQTTTSLLSAADPLTLFRERMLDAERAVSMEGDFGGAVIAGALGGEVLLDAVLGLLLWEKSSAPASDGPVEDAAETIGKPFRARLRSAYHPLIGGTWTPNGGGPLDIWDGIARLRGRILHRGYRPRAVETGEALDSVNKLYGQIAQLIANKAGLFPRTALMIVGEEGLKEREKWDQVRKFASDRAKAEPPWRDNYAEWRNRVDLRLRQ